MQISAYNKIQALIRISQYRKDFEEYKKKRSGPNDTAVPGPTGLIVNLQSAEAKALCTKYNIPFPLDPDADLKPWEKYFSSKYCSAVFLPFYRQDKGNPFTSIVDENGLIEERYLPVLIDLTQPKNVILKELKKVLTRLVESSRERDRKSKIEKEIGLDIWQVWDMVHKEGKNRLQITKELFGITENPTYDARAKACYEQVTRACNKAKEIIQEVEQQSRSI